MIRDTEKSKKNWKSIKVPEDVYNDLVSACEIIEDSQGSIIADMLAVLGLSTHERPFNRFKNWDKEQTSRFFKEHVRNKSQFKSGLKNIQNISKKNKTSTY